MDKKKITLLIVIFLIFIIGIYFILPTPFPNKVTVVLTILDNQYLNTYCEQVVEKTLDEFTKNIPLEVEFKVLSTSSLNKRNAIIKIKPGESEIVWNNRIRNIFNELLKDSVYTNITNQSINDLIMQTVHLISEIDNKNKNYIIFTGSFPDCYDKISTELLKSQITQKVKDININSQNKSTIIWSVLDTRANEEDILVTIKNTRLANVIDRRIIFEKSRDCIEEKRNNIYGIFFDKLSLEKAMDFIKKMHSQFGDNLKLTIWNDGALNNKVIYLSNNDILNKENLEIFNQLEVGQWTSIGFLLKQSANFFAQLDDSLSKNLVIIGNFPQESKGNQLDPKTWDLIKKIQNLTIYFYRSNFLKLNSTDKEFLFGLNYHKISYNEIR